MSSSKRPAKKPPQRARPPASARLTIKPGLPSGPRMTIELPPRPRPGGIRRLNEVLLEEDEVLTDGFDATLHDLKVRVTAVLERTCVYLSKEGDRRLASNRRPVGRGGQAADQARRYRIA